MIFARSFYTIFLFGFSLLMLLELARFLFGRSYWSEKSQTLIRGTAFTLLWPLALLSPAGRLHYRGLFGFVFSRSKSEVIDIRAHRNPTNETSANSTHRKEK